MSFQPGLCSVNRYLVAAWKDKPAEFSIGEAGHNDGISYALFDGQDWVVQYVIPGVTSIGVSLSSVYGTNNAPAVYAAWKGDTGDVSVYTSVFTSQGAESSILGWSWELQTPVPNAASASGPTIACLQSDGPTAVVVFWVGTSPGQSYEGAHGELTIWYLANSIADDGSLSSFTGLPTQLINGSSANFVQVAVANTDILYIVWFDNATKVWTCQQAQLGNFNAQPPDLIMGTVTPLPSRPNAGGYSMCSFDFGPTTQNPIYLVWVDESNRIFGSSFDNLVAEGAGTPIPGASGQATTRMGCGLAERGDKLYAVWPDLTGQLCYASSSDGLKWEYLGIIAGATSGPDVSHPPLPIRLPPIEAKL